MILRRLWKWWRKLFGKILASIVEPCIFVLDFCKALQHLATKLEDVKGILHE